MNGCLTRPSILKLIKEKVSFESQITRLVCVLTLYLINNYKVINGTSRLCIELFSVYILISILSLLCCLGLLIIIIINN